MQPPAELLEEGVQDVYDSRLAEEPWADLVEMESELSLGLAKVAYEEMWKEYPALTPRPTVVTEPTFGI